MKQLHTSLYLYKLFSLLFVAIFNVISGAYKNTCVYTISLLFSYFFKARPVVKSKLVIFHDQVITDCLIDQE